MRLELLAPAGDMKSFEAALNSGADAVYLGLGDFNARMKAENFTVDNIGEVVARAHFLGVKVYVTINTILQNQEFKSLFELVNACVRAKVDAYLVQDLGVAYALKQAFPNIVLHASTQLGVHNLYGAKVAEKFGFERVVLSRETKLEDIKEIRANTNLEIEYFVQGALCIAFSGNCYMSSKEQGASGNRGLCKQLCRLPYLAGFEKDGKFEKAGDGYLLSARDLSLASSLKELIDAGVSSFKIEGRLRREGFVAEAVSVYRHLIDRIENGRNPQDFSLTSSEQERLKTAFSRGEYLERAYLDAGTPFVVEKRFNSHIGRRIGIVKKVSPFKDGLFEITIESTHPLASGDGLKFFDKDVERASLGVGNPKSLGRNLYSFVTKTAVRVGDGVNLTLNSVAEDEALAVKRLVPVSMQVKALAGKPLEITACTADGNKYTAKSDNPLEKATNIPTSVEEIEKQCSKVADSGFEVFDLAVETNGVFLPKSVVNGVRREALAGLKAEIISFFERKIKAEPIENVDEILANICKDDCTEQAGTVERWQRVETEKNSTILKKGERVLLAPADYSADAVARTLDLLDIDGKDAALQLPIIANSEDLKVIENTLNKCGIKTLVSENIYGLYFADKGYDVVAGAGHNIANRFAVQGAKALGAQAFCSSVEFSQEGGDSLPRIEIASELPLMTFAHCPFKTIFGTDCSKCSYRPGLVLKRERHEYTIRRIRISKCYFQLYPKQI